MMPQGTFTNPAAFLLLALIFAIALFFNYKYKSEESSGFEASTSKEIAKTFLRLVSLYFSLLLFFVYCIVIS